MYNNQKEVQIINNNLKGIRSQEVRAKASILTRVLNAKNKTIAVETIGWTRFKYYFWLNRLRQNNYNLDALLKQSTRPKTNSRQIKQSIIDLALKVRNQNRDCGAKKISILMKQKYHVFIHSSTLGYILQKRGISQRYRIHRKNKHKRRYSLEKPLERVQTDTTHLNISDNFGNKIKAYPVIDDCTRMATVHLAAEHSSYEATQGVIKFLKTIGIPESVQTDNGTEFTNYYTSLNNPRRNKPSIMSCFEQMLDENNIDHRLIRPATPQLNGKVERFNRTFKRECISKLKDGMTIKEMQKNVDIYFGWYNKCRPHASLNYFTPQQKFLQVFKE